MTFCFFSSMKKKKKKKKEKRETFLSISNAISHRQTGYKKSNWTQKKKKKDGKNQQIQSSRDNSFS